MKAIWPIFKKEFLHVVRDPRTLIVTLVMPVLLLLLFGYALTFDIKNISLGVHDTDKTVLSRGLVERFRASGKFEFLGSIESMDAINGRLKDGTIKMAIIIPKGFGDSIQAGKPGRFHIVVDASNPIVAKSARNYALVIPQAYAQELLKQRNVKISPAGRIDIRSTILYNPALASVNFIVPGIITLILMMIPAVITSTAIVREKETGTLEQIIVSPIKPYQLMVGKVAPYLVISAFDAFLITVVGVYWFNVPLNGNPWWIVLAVIFYMFSTVGIGLMISTVAETQIVAQMGAFLATLLPSFLLSGFVFPISSMPVVVQYITYIVPARYFLSIVRAVFLRGAGINVFWPEALVLLIMGSLLLTASTIRFRRRLF